MPGSVKASALEGGEFPIVRGFSLTLIDLGEMGKSVRFCGSGGRIIGGMSVNHADGAIRRHEMEIVPQGSRDNPYVEDGEKVWLKLWIENKFVYIAQGAASDAFQPRFRVAVDDYFGAWLNLVSKVKSSEGAFFDLDIALDQSALVTRLVLTGDQDSGSLARIPSLSKLIQLNMQKSDSESLFPSIGALSGLRWLDVSENSLTSIPDGIENLDKLETFSAQWNNIDMLPGGICGLENLNYLNFTGNQLTVIPSCLSRAKSLRDVRLKRNRFSDDVRERIAREFSVRPKVRLLI